MLARFTVYGFALVLVGLASVVPGVAHAGNGTHPRTPVLWEPEPACLTVVDRTIDAKLAFNYTIPYEDLRPENAIDEVFLAGTEPTETATRDAGVEDASDTNAAGEASDAGAPSAVDAPTKPEEEAPPPF